MGVVLVDEHGNPVQGDALVILPDNQPAADLFYRSHSQWNFCGMSGQRISLNYQGVESAARLSGTTITPQLFDDLQTLERGALGDNPEFPDLATVKILSVSDDEQEL